MSECEYCGFDAAACDCRNDDEGPYWRVYDPNVCPDCGGDIDAEGYCSMLECGYCIHDDDEAAADAERAENEGGYEG